MELGFSADIEFIMERFRILAAVFAGTFFYVLMSIVCGRDGIWAQRQLQEQKQALSAHTAIIEKTNDELSLEKIALQKDLDVVAAYARKLGFVSENEKLVKISGLPVRETHIFDPGTVQRHNEVKFMPEWICKSCALVIMILFYMVLFLYDLHRGYISFPQFARRNKTVSIGGISVYDMQ